MTAYNVVRFRVRNGQEKAFLDVHRSMKRDFPGMHRFTLVKTGDRTYCAIGEWDNMKNIVDARPSMISNLDRMRPMLEDLGGGLGLTDPVSGEAVIE